MIPTYFGAIIAAAAIIIMVRRSLTAMLVLVMVCSLFGGAAAANLPALGGSSIPPAHFALGFLALNVALSRVGTAANLAEAARKNIILVFFGLYGVVAALLLPRVFAHTMAVAPMRPLGPAAGLFGVVPLAPSSQNVTTAVYLLGGVLAAICTVVVLRAEAKHEVLIKTVIALAWCHVLFGLVSAFNPHLLDIFRNGNYAQLDQSVAGFRRINGVQPEPSSYASYGFALFAINAELWLRNIRGRAAGTAALALAVMLICTTASTAYVALAGYTIVIGLRLLFTPTRIPASKIVIFCFLGLVALSLALGLSVFMPHLGDRLVDVLKQMTLHKASSESGQQRLFWMRQGYSAFWQSHGLGIGPGSFRSSSLISAIAGSMGVVGLLAFAAQLLVLARPFDRRWQKLRRNDDNICAAFGWAAVIAIIPSMASAAGPDPGLFFGVLSGVAVANLRVPRGVEARKPLASAIAAYPGRTGD